MKVLAFTVAAILATVPLAPASAGVIRGTLRIPGSHTRTTEVANAYPGRAQSMPGMHMTTQRAVTDAVVYVETIPAAVNTGLTASAPPPPRLAQKDQMFVPRVVVVAAGSAVEFPNMDPIYHNVFSLSPTRRFDLGKYPKGSSRRVTFTKTGLVNVYCDIHSNMEAFILVVPNHAFTRPDAGGEFELPDLPAGSYALHVWHPDLGEQTLPVQVPATGDVVEALSF
jgi:plastocyanin